MPYMNTRNLAIGGLVVAALAGATAYAIAHGSNSPHAMPGMTNETMSSGGNLLGMFSVGDITGLSSSADGNTLKLATANLSVTKPQRFSFRVLGSNNEPVRTFQVEATKKMHLILVRRDLTNYQHIHPTMASDGTWSIATAVPAPGSYRAYMDFATNGKRTVLGVDLKAPGASTSVALPEPRARSRVDGYEVAMHSDMLTSESSVELRFTVSRNGVPVTSLEPYLGNLGHLVILRERTLQYMHVHPRSSGGAGPGIPFATDFSYPGRYRAFLQFRTGGKVHTSAFTLQVHTM
jgi:hypothetical protein